VIVIGGGLGGLNLARALARAPVHITLVDRQNHHLFQPLLYQVAMAGLAPGEVAVPIRGVLRLQDNVRVLLSEVTDIDLGARLVRSREAAPLEYDYLVIRSDRGREGARRRRSERKRSSAKTRSGASSRRCASGAR
jgi:NADH:ubiquinone reductase (H+-translocating)